MHIGIKLERARLKVGLSRRQVFEILQKRGVTVPKTFLRDIETTGLSRHIAVALPKMCEIYQITISSVFGVSDKTDVLIQNVREIQKYVDKILIEAAR